jgi:hypothetical protein
LRSVLLAGVAFCVAPAAAHAAVVSYTVDELPAQDAVRARVEHRLVVQAAPGEANRLTFEFDQFGFAVLDAGPAPQPGPGCNPPRGDGHTIGCDVRLRDRGDVNETVTARVSLGDGDDTAQISQLVGGRPITLRIDGGPGADRLRGADSGAEELTLIGGSGADELVGGALPEFLDGSGGEDTIRGGPGDDRLVSDLGHDVLEGGPGRDQIAGAGARTECGAGQDIVAPWSSRAFVTLPYSCEVVQLANDIDFQLPRGGPLTLIWGGPDLDARVEVRAGGRTVVRERVRLDAPTRRRIRVPGVAGRKLVTLRRRGKATLGFGRPAR